jgi:DNA polymerase III sliding clamp (beta) subunit (PCNA family)
MHVIVPTGDFSRLLSRLKPMRAITTTGFAFPIYSLEAHQNKIRLIISDNSSIVASSEIFATVKEPGTVCLNGEDFVQMVAKIPAINTANTGSKNLELKSTNTKLNLSTDIHYSKIGKNVSQKRSFSLVNATLSARDDFDPQGDNAVRIKLPATYLSDVFKVLGKTVARYTSDMAGLSGVLIRCKDQTLLFVVSDGFRIIEIKYPDPIPSKDFDLIIPKLTCTLLQSLIYDGDELEILSDRSQIKFRIDTAGLITSVLSSLVVAYFPPYESIFNVSGEVLKVYTHILLENISNVRSVLEEEPYRIKMEFNKQALGLKSLNQSTHVSFANEEIPLLTQLGAPFELIVNAILLESSLAILGADTIQLTVPDNNKPIIIDNCDDTLRIKIAVALAEPD